METCMMTDAYATGKGKHPPGLRSSKPLWIGLGAAGRTGLLVSALLVAAAGSVAVWTQAQEKPPLTPAELQLNVDSFEHIWKTIHEKHFDPTFGGVDWQAVRLELLPRIKAARNKSEARAVMREMLSRMKLTHFGIIPSELYPEADRAGGKSPADGVTGITVRVVNGHALVTSVEPGSPAERQGIKPGWEILRIGDLEVVPRLASLAKEVEARTLKELILSDAVAARLEGRIGDAVTVSFLDGRDKAREISIALAEPRGTRFQLGNLPPAHVWIDVKTINSDIGYIAFNIFLAPGILMPSFNDAMKAFMNSAGIIIDLRGNTGGQGEIAVGMAGWLVREQGRYFGSIQTRESALKMIIRPRPEVYSGPVAILVDGMSLCATEIFAGGLRDLGRARIFGSHTGGVALGGSVEKLPNGDAFMYAVANYVTAGGQVLEGSGLVPDVEIHPTREALLQSKDLVLEAAAQWIRTQGRKKISYEKEE